MTTTIQINSTQVERALAELASRTVHLQPAFNAIGVEIHRRVVDCFEHEQSPDGINWAALSPATLKKRTSSNANILRDTGAMYETLGHNATDSYAEVSIGTIGQDYAKFHQFGTEHIPARPFFPSENLPQEWESDVMNVLNNFLAV
jgi:phage virion morphogenesis protein